MGDKTPATTTQTQNTTNTSNPWAAATPLLNNLIGNYLGTSTAVTPAQQAAGTGLTDAAGNLVSSTGDLTGAATNVAGAGAPLTGAAANMIGAAAPQTGAAQGLMTAAQGVPNLTPQSTAAIQQMFQNAGMLNNAYGQTQANLSPIAGMSANPYQTPGFSDALNTLTQNITNATKGVYAASGRDPSGAGSFAGSLGRGLMQGEAPIIQSQYNQNLGNIMSANQMLQNAGINTVGALGGNTMQALQGAGILPSLQMAPAQAQWAASQAPLQAAQAQYGAAGMPLQAALTQYGAATQPMQAAQAQFQAAQQPWNVANMVQQQPITNINQLLQPASVLGGMGGTTTGTGNMYGQQTPANDPFANIIGGISAGAGLLGALPLSDRRAKTDIRDIGRTHDKQKIYSYRFKGSNIPQIGMMAQEVEKKHPDAVVTGPDGFKRLNYDRATRKAATMGMLKAA